MIPQRVDLNAVEENSDVIDFKTRFNFLLSHNGIRKNKLHTLLAPTHSGKSTAVRTLVVDMMVMNPNSKILIWLSEESVNDFLIELKKCLPSTISTDNLMVLSDINWNEYLSEKTHDEIKAQIESFISYYKIDFVFIDNITTSKIYNDCTIKEQSQFANWLKKISQDCGVLCIAHTNTNEFNNRLINENDIRGSKTIINLSEFLYILQPIFIGNTLIQFVFIKKHRGQEVAAKFYRLNYDKHLYAFKDDYSVEFSSIAELFKNRNKLGK
jgi:hypothetical protein